MKLTRRKALAGIGIGAVGAAGVFGSGAFTSVTADRDVGIDIVEDSDGLLGVEVLRSDEASFVSDGGDAIEFDFEDVNTEAEIGFTELLITNNGDRPVRFWIDNSDAAGEANVDDLRFFVGVKSIDDGEFEFLDDEPNEGEATVGLDGEPSFANEGVVLEAGADVPIAGILQTEGTEADIDTSVTLIAVGDGDERRPGLGPAGGDDINPDGGNTATVYGDDTGPGDDIDVEGGTLEVTAQYIGGTDPDFTSGF